MSIWAKVISILKRQGISMKTKNYINVFIFGLSFLMISTSDCMKTKNIHSLIKKYAFMNFIPTFTKSYTNSFKNSIIELRNEIQPLGRQTKVNFSMGNMSSIGYTLYDNMLYTDATTKKKYATLDILFVYQTERKMGIGTKIFKTTIDIIRTHFPQIEMVKWSVSPIGMFETHTDFMNAKYNLYQFYRKLGAKINEETGQAVLHLEKYEKTHQMENCNNDTISMN